MPGWHKDTKDAVAKGTLLVAGIAPEQHGDRMALFLQWQKMQDMTVMIDSYNVLGLDRVPITLLIDEAGIIRHRNPSRESFQKFLQAAPAEVGSAPPAPTPIALKPLAGLPADGRPVNILWDSPHGIKAPESESLTKAIAHFQRGVTKLNDSQSRRGHPKEFQEAINHWQQALSLDPANYIWRRHLQQYGPRLDKPYPFYDWIAEARSEISARGEKPLTIQVEPCGAEVAKPEKPGNSRAAGDAPPHPDPDNKLPQDIDGLFSHEVVYVSSTTKKTDAYRVFINSQPIGDDAKWNDEAGLSTIRIIPPINWSAHPAVLTYLPQKGAPPNAPRVAEFELRRTKPAVPLEGRHAFETNLQFFLHVCHGDPEVCEYLRFDASSALQSSP